MYAIVEISGEQVKVTPGEEIFVPFISEKTEGENLTFDNVLLISDEKEPIIGKPHIEGASVVATVVGHAKGEKIKVFKKIRRTGYHKTQGHRQNYTKIRIDEIKK